MVNFDDSEELIEELVEILSELTMMLMKES
jgi:hypothetical protein